jgi:hypothetical protein
MRSGMKADSRAGTPARLPHLSSSAEVPGRIGLWFELRLDFSARPSFGASSDRSNRTLLSLLPWLLAPGSWLSLVRVEEGEKAWFFEGRAHSAAPDDWRGTCTRVRPVEMPPSSRWQKRTLPPFLPSTGEHTIRRRVSRARSLEENRSDRRVALHRGETPIPPPAHRTNTKPPPR